MRTLLSIRFVNSSFETHQWISFKGLMKKVSYEMTTSFFSSFQVESNSKRPVVAIYPDQINDTVWQVGLVGKSGSEQNKATFEIGPDEQRAEPLLRWFTFQTKQWFAFRNWPTSKENPFGKSDQNRYLRLFEIAQIYFSKEKGNFQTSLGGNDKIHNGK